MSKKENDSSLLNKTDLELLQLMKEIFFLKREKILFTLEIAVKIANILNSPYFQQKNIKSTLIRKNNPEEIMNKWRKYLDYLKDIREKEGIREESTSKNNDYLLQELEDPIVQEIEEELFSKTCFLKTDTSTFLKASKEKESSLEKKLEKILDNIRCTIIYESPFTIEELIKDINFFIEVFNLEESFLEKEEQEKQILVKERLHLFSYNIVFKANGYSHIALYFKYGDFIEFQINIEENIKLKEEEHKNYQNAKSAAQKIATQITDVFDTDIAYQFFKELESEPQELTKQELEKRINNFGLNLVSFCQKYTKLKEKYSNKIKNVSQEKMQIFLSLITKLYDYYNLSKTIFQKMIPIVSDEAIPVLSESLEKIKLNTSL